MLVANIILSYSSFEDTPSRKWRTGQPLSCHQKQLQREGVVLKPRSRRGHQIQNSMGKQMSRATTGQEKRKGSVVGTHHTQKNGLRSKEGTDPRTSKLEATRRGNVPTWVQHYLVSLFCLCDTVSSMAQYSEHLSL